MENTVENKIIFLNQNLKSNVVGDFSRYFNGTPKKGIFSSISGYLNGINKNETQQFDVDFNLKDGFEFYNCFNDLCRRWSHTIHAEHLTVIKKSLLNITYKDAKSLALSVGLVNAKVSQLEGSVIIRDDSYAIIIDKDGINMYYRGKTWNDDQILIIDKIRSMGYAYAWMGLSIEKLIEFKWLKLKES